MTLLAGTDGGVFEVANGTVRQRLESRCVRDLVRVSGRIFAGTDAGLFVSDDNGANWSRRGLENRQIWQIRDAGDGSLYLATQPAGLFRSRDGGESWREIESLMQIDGADAWCLPVTPPAKARARALVIDRDDPRRIRLGVEVGGIMASDDGGETWNAVLPGDNPDLHMMIADPARPGVLYTSTGYGRFDGEAERIEGNAGMFRSDDYGATWRYVWVGIEPRYSRPLCVDPRPPHGVTVGSAPSAFSKCQDPQGAEAMLFRSEDGCETWRSLCDAAHSPSRANFHGLAPDPDAPGGVIVGTDNGEVWRVSNDAEWTLLGDGMPLVASVLPAYPANDAQPSLSA